MHFLPRWLKRISFSCCVSSNEPTFVCRRCGGCPLIIGDQFKKYAPTVTRYKRSKKIHKQSLGHPWPSSDPLTPVQFFPGGLQDWGAKNYMLFKKAMRNPVPLENTVKTAAAVRRRKTLKTFLRSPAAREPGASSIQHGSVRTIPLSGNGGHKFSRLRPTYAVRYNFGATNEEMFTYKELKHVQIFW